jgi:hypothetical protein
VVGVEGEGEAAVGVEEAEAEVFLLVDWVPSGGG